MDALAAAMGKRDEAGGHASDSPGSISGSESPPRGGARAGHGASAGSSINGGDPDGEEKRRKKLELNRIASRVRREEGRVVQCWMMLMMAACGVIEDVGVVVAC